MYGGRLRLYVRIQRMQYGDYDWFLITEDDIKEEGSLGKKKGTAHPQVIPQMRLESSLSLGSKLAWSGTSLYAIGGEEKIYSPLKGGYYGRPTTRVMSFNPSAASSISPLAKMDYWCECSPSMPMVLIDLVTTVVDNELFVFGVNKSDICFVHMINLQSPRRWSEMEVLEGMEVLYPHYCFVWEPEVGGERMKRLVVLFSEYRQVIDDLYSVREFFYFDIKTREWAFLAETSYKDFGPFINSLFVHDGEDTLFNICLYDKEWFAYDLTNKCVKGKVMGWEALEELMGCAIDGVKSSIADCCSLGNREFLLLWNTFEGSFCYLSKVKISDDLVLKVQSFRQLWVGKDYWIRSCVPICVPQQQTAASTIDNIPLLGETRESNQESMDGKLGVYVSILRRDFEYDWFLITDDDINNCSLEKKWIMWRLLHFLSGGKNNAVTEPGKKELVPQVIPEMRLESGLGIHCMVAWADTVLYAISDNRDRSGMVRSIDTAATRYSSSSSSDSSSSVIKKEWSRFHSIPTTFVCLVTNVVDGQLFLLGREDHKCCMYKYSLESAEEVEEEWFKVEVHEDMKRLSPYYCFLLESYNGWINQRMLVVLLWDEMLEVDYDNDDVKVKEWKFYYYDLRAKEWELWAEASWKEFGHIMHSFVVRDDSDTLFNMGPGKEWYAYDIATRRGKGKVTGLEAVEVMQGYALDGCRSLIVDGCSLGNREFLILWTSKDSSVYFLCKVKVTADLVARVQSFGRLLVDNARYICIKRCVPICVPHRTRSTIDVPLLGEAQNSNLLKNALHAAPLILASAGLVFMGVSGRRKTVDRGTGIIVRRPEPADLGMG